MSFQFTHCGHAGDCSCPKVLLSDDFDNCDCSNLLWTDEGIEQFKENLKIVFQGFAEYLKNKDYGIG